VIDKEEFKKIMALMRSINRQGATHSDGLRIGLKVGHPVENGGVVKYFFGNDGNEPLH
jgi:calcium uptake protein 1, mitochondrial